MANNNKAKRRINWALIIAVLLAIAVAVETTGIFLGWFAPRGDEASEPWHGLIATPDKNNAMKMSVTRSSLNGEDAQAEEGYTLTVTLNEDATYKDVTWSFAWETESADDISQYFEVTANGLTATAKSLQPLPTPIIVTATSDFETTLSASCKFDYLKELQSVTLSVNGPVVLEGETPYSIACEYGVGTIQGEYQLIDFVFDLRSIVGKIENSNYYKAAVLLDNQINCQKSVAQPQFTDTAILASYSDCFVYGADKAKLPTAELSDSIISGLKAAVAGSSGTLRINTRGNYVYGEYSKVKNSDVISSTFDASNLATPVTDMNLDKDHIIIYPN